MYVLDLPQEPPLEHSAGLALPSYPVRAPSYSIGV